MPSMRTRIQRSQQCCRLPDETRAFRRSKVTSILTILLILRCTSVTVLPGQTNAKAVLESQQTGHALHV